MAQKYKRRTKNFFIKKNLQGKIILAVFLAVTIGCLFFIVVFGFFSSDTMTISYQNNDLLLGQTPVMLFKKALAASWIFLLICGTILVILSILGSHRIAGPLFHLEKVLDKMAAKDLSYTVFLRNKDEAKDLALKINHLNENLSRDFHDLSRQSKAINDLIIRYTSLGNAKLSQDEIEAILTAIKNKNDKMIKLLATYQLKDDSTV